ncbi:A24 family peptidase [Enterocloster lavalensis]|uniref:A24 family peptidase n=1 Tax=Enterocloster lavalensis TaxID=460384 RepID=UPI0026665A6A|nr:A24 family peptidase [Enterocloster lavalensis]
MQKNWIFMIYLAVCAGWDGKTRRIPNWLTVVGLAGGVVMAGMQGIWEATGMYGAAMAAFGRAVTAVAAGMCLYRFRVIGAGDVKLAAVIVAWLGFAQGDAGIFAGLCLGAVWSFGRLVRRGILWKRFSYLAGYVRDYLTTGKIAAYYNRERDGDEAAIPLGVCLAVGTVVVMFFAGNGA